MKPENLLWFDPSEDGQWIQPTMKSYKVACCDCGLVHRMDFRIVDGRVQFRAFRHVELTRQRRKNCFTILSSGIRKALGIK